MKYRKRIEGLEQRQRTFDALKDSKGVKRPGSFSGGGPASGNVYRKGVGSQRSREAAR